ncbi:helix-turn-helix domain-containing protein [Bifidobacterium sp. SMB2]|uniref:Helix-turn-helix domain-containing protein n=1 Tax=Bifidobacterium saimiriisciurei TaxID=2661627 RepID=A0ABX0CIL7_9BIFI|nr:MULTISPECIES: helix-turn-helix transcriptional regulator [Bifidobacterium]NEG96636.1 helix-turn-helix domain-containing protein [Bifidobacterium sp. SMB2]NEH12558.1 helix-turn-helix domain-containing protein [Bifidobacterium saimiriisciurei]
MAVPEIERRWIDKFQENLSIVRKVAGWTTQQLADELGVARQTVSNLETGRSPMTKLQYLALRTVFNAEIAEQENRDLARVIKTLVDDPMQNADEVADTDADDGLAEGVDGSSETAVTNRGGKRGAAAHGRSTVVNNGKAETGRPVTGAAMQILAAITGALASGAAAGALAFLMLPDGKSGR